MHACSGLTQSETKKMRPKWTNINVLILKPLIRCENGNLYIPQYSLILEIKEHFTLSPLIKYVQYLIL